MTLAEQLKAEGLAQGLQEGIQKGLQEGLQEGIQKGKFEVAKQLLIEGVDITFVAKITDIPQEKLKVLNEEVLLS